MKGLIALAGLLCAVTGFSGGIYIGSRLGYEKGVHESEASWKLSTERGDLICAQPSVVAAAIEDRVTQLAHQAEIDAHRRTNENDGTHGVWGWAPGYNRSGEIVSYRRYDTGVPYSKWTPITTGGP